MAVMKDGTGADELAELSRRELCQAYVNCYAEVCTEVGPCRDTRLLSKAAEYLLREPEPSGTFTVFPFYEAVTDSPDALGTDCRKHLSAFVKATELLETLCVNLFLHPWKKEIRTLKVFFISFCFIYFILFYFTTSTC